MKYAVRYETAPEGMAKVAELFPRHQALWKGYLEAGTLLMIGPMADPTQGALAVFATRDAADPFVTEGLVARWEILEWNEVLVPEVPR